MCFFGVGNLRLLEHAQITHGLIDCIDNAKANFEKQKDAEWEKIATQTETKNKYCQKR